MHFRTLLAAGAIATAATSPVSAQETGLDQALRALQRIATQYAVLLTRMFVDLTYDGIAVEPGTNDLILTGLRLYPELEWDQDRRCQIAVERAVFADSNSFDILHTTVELSGLHLPPACFQPELAAAMAGFGYEGLTADSMAIDLAYHLPSSAADMVVQASVEQAAEVSLTAHFDYLWFRFPVTGAVSGAVSDAVSGAEPGAESGATDPEMAPAEAVPVARLGSAELVIENAGLWQRLEPMLAAQMGGDLSMLPQMVQMTAAEFFTDGGTRTPSPEEAAFVENLASEVGRFLADRDRIVVTAAPRDGSVLLTQETMGSPGALIAALHPVVSAAPRAYREMIAPADLETALAGGDGLDPELRLRVGRALVTGIGAPRAIDAGWALLAPLADQWNPSAALLAGEASRDAGDPQTAYSMALRAMSGGEPGAIALADELEPTLPLVAVLAAQAEAAGAWPGAADAQATAAEVIGKGDVGAMRRRAYAAATGHDRPRDYAEAYFCASLAAAAGDRGAASLRKRLDDRFAGQEGWRDVAQARADAALETWTSGLGQTIAARIR
jgi:hypothetical protein